MTLAQAAVSDVEAVSGATLSSESIIHRGQRSFASDVKVEEESTIKFSLEDIAALLVIAFGVAMSFFPLRKK